MEDYDIHQIFDQLQLRVVYYLRAAIFYRNGILSVRNVQ